VNCLTEKGGKRNTARHHPRETSSPESADPNRYTELLNTGSAKRSRTLAYFIVRRPRGVIAAALQYGHLATKVTMSYAGQADPSWLDDLAIERLELVIEKAGQDHALLEDGEHVSGPSSAEYRARVERAAGFAGRVVTSVRNAERLLAHADQNIHHGDGMTCVWTKETAACRKTRLAARLPDADAPDDSECHTSCVNLARTDRDIRQLAGRLAVIEERAGDPLAPRPLRDRAAAQAADIRAIIARQDQARPQHAPDGRDDGPPAPEPGRRPLREAGGGRPAPGRDAAGLSHRQAHRHRADHRVRRLGTHSRDDLLVLCGHGVRDAGGPAVAIDVRRRDQPGGPGGVPLPFGQPRVPQHLDRAEAGR
jgi:hypothetical protein